MGTPLLRSDPFAVPQAGERETGSLREFCASHDRIRLRGFSYHRRVDIAQCDARVLARGDGAVVLDSGILGGKFIHHPIRADVAYEYPHPGAAFAGGFCGFVFGRTAGDDPD